MSPMNSSLTFSEAVWMVMGAFAHSQTLSIPKLKDCMLPCHQLAYLSLDGFGAEPELFLG